MKKKVFTIIGLVAIGAATAFNANIGLRGSDSLSDLALANIEALAKAEVDLDCVIQQVRYLYSDGCYYTLLMCNDGLKICCKQECTAK